jgi:hypothetical protein
VDVLWDIANLQVLVHPAPEASMHFACWQCDLHHTRGPVQTSTRPPVRQYSPRSRDRNPSSTR